MTVALRRPLQRAPSAHAGAIATLLVALGVAVVAVLVDPAVLRDSLGDALPFAIAGVLAPGAAQLLFTAAVRDAGPARASILIGTAPLAAMLLALSLLDEPFR